jgi:hypothetical protein
MTYNNNDGPIYSVLNGKPTCTTAWNGNFNDFENPSAGYTWSYIESYVTETEGSTWDYCYCGDTSNGAPTPPNRAPTFQGEITTTLCPVGNQFD